MNNSTENASVIELHFVLNIVDEWPTVAVEGILCSKIAGWYQIKSPPMFVKGLSVGDQVAVDFDPEGKVISWKISDRSDRTTIWILRIGPQDNISAVLHELQAISCETVQLPTLGCYSVDVPAEVPIAAVDAVLAKLDERNAAVVFPSYRHG